MENCSGQGVQEQYTYEIGKATFIVTPVYREAGKTIEQALETLMKSDVDKI